MLNNVSIIGRLVSDPELKELSNGMGYTCNFTIIWEDFYKGEKKAHRIRCSCWNKLAENLCKYCMKGSLVSVNGKLKTNSYEKFSGETVYNTFVLCTDIDFISSPKIKTKVIDRKAEYEEASKKIDDFGIEEDDIQF